MGAPLTRADQAATRTVELVAMIRPILSGEPPETVGPCLAELLATLLAGVIVVGDKRATRKAREEILKVHIEATRKLLPLMEQTYVEPQLRRIVQ